MTMQPERGADVPLPDLCVHELFARHAAAAPEAAAVWYGEERLGYGELDQRANRFAHLLRARGIGPETPVVLCLERGTTLLVAMLGILKAGGYYVPLDPGYPPERLAFMLGDSGAAVAVTERALADRVQAAPTVVLADEADLGGWPDTPPDADVVPDNLIYQMYTSGSTGLPKGVQVTHRGVVRLVHGSGFADFGAGEVFLLLTSLCFDVSTFELWGALATGAALAVLPPGVPAAASIEAAVRRFGVTTVWLSSGLFGHVVDDRVTALAGVRHVIAGGDVVPPVQARRVIEELGAEMSNGYGPTECTTFACVHRGMTVADTAGPIPIGKPIANTHAFVTGADGVPVEPGERGELLLGGPGLARGYFRRPALTAERFVPDPAGGGGRLYRTGDEVALRPDGTFAFFGRLDQQVKIRGFRVEPGEVEAALTAHPLVRSAVVVPCERDGGDRVLAAHVVASRPAAAELREFLLARLPAHLVPSLWSWPDELPITPNGKVDRAALPEPEEARPAGEFVVPRTPAEEAVAEVWRELLDLERVGVHDDFFADLGGHSLLATRVVALLGERFPVELPVSTVFEASTVELLAAEVHRAVTEYVAALSDVDVQRALS
ncbi:non-ribosomal peptide synthetase [Amycolatopsis rubida]|uniref:Non-ribosomal peptide synthetase n=1 Tax=Amycolatopsis rubida TaxID=112413 RepID=A0ABX0BWR3_9PSEU|nr:MULTISPECIES: non-ribosomal peptide synthetase [Amycolatopsis]MYW92248.1 amino acid adenylation domain-containing protein [Amycolatopsis rubida]NEC57235.1 non-ribosomal peptide synthetase [Amycolatopsis rubida]OAP21328.1 Linear gramicidin synthase subunit B [Amycolatopsis sp. M39]